MDATIFVFYTFNTQSDKDKNWSWDPLPKGWWSVGTGSTNGEGGYLREEQLTGPNELKAVAVKQIKNVLTRLKKDGILTKFKIRHSYKPGITKTKKGRKGPVNSASIYNEGTVKKGQNGKDWIIVKDKRGIGRWTRRAQK